MKNKFIAACILQTVLLFLQSASGQESAGDKKNPISLVGYIKDLQMIVNDPIDAGYLYANQIHNRLNLSWYAGSLFTIKIEARNRIFTGSLVSDIPGFEDFLDDDPGVVDLSYTEGFGSNSVASFQLDRAWVGFRKGKWDASVGRQRINWGVNNVWNPNDIFNAYNYFEFDYEERPGSDAARVQFSTGDLSFIEAVAAWGSEADDVTCAMIYRFNTRGYDIQILGGSSQKQPLIGLGWAGNILDAGFKTEATWYGRQQDASSESGIVISTGLDYTIDPGWYLNLSYLYNSRYSGSLTGILSTLTSPDPFPYEHAVLMQVVKEINPVWNVNFTTIYSAENNIAVIPAISWSLATNWELLGYTQYFQSLDDTGVNNTDFFLRLKWSFASRD